MADDDLGVTEEPKKGSNAAAKDEALIQVSGSVDPDLFERIKARSEEEDRTVTVIVRRALKAYMKDWEPGQDD